MHHRSTLHRRIAAGVAAASAVLGLHTAAVAAAPAPAGAARAPIAAAGPHSTPPARPAAIPAADPHRPLPATAAVRSDAPAFQRAPVRSRDLPPLQPVLPEHRARHGDGAATPAAAASCTAADFGTRTGSALVSFVEASTTACVNTLFALTGTDAHNVFRQAQMMPVAQAFTALAPAYPGDDSTRVEQLVLFLRAGLYVQSYHPGDVGSYDASLTAATDAGMDAFFAGPHFMDATDANGEVRGEVVILTDSADQQDRYLDVYQQVLNGYTSAYDAMDHLTASVNDVYTPLFRGHWNPAYVAAVTADPSIVDTLDAFAERHMDLLGTGLSYLDANAGRELGHDVEITALRPKVRPLMLGLLGRSSVTGPTAQLWVPVAQMADTYDQGDCAYYGVCGLQDRLIAASLPTTYHCDADITLRVQSLTAAQLAEVCGSLGGEVPFFHALVKDSGPVADDHSTTDQINVFASRTDYQTYAEAIFGIDTDNGGITIEGDPSQPGNQAYSVEYVKSPDDGFPAGVWNLNHEFTHYLDGRFDTYGDFAAESTVPDIWWIEGLAEYVSYTYRGVPDTEALDDARQHTYVLSTLWQSSYANSDVTRTYPWGYLAVRYMVERHPDDVQAILAKFRAGDFQGAYRSYATTIGNRYDADFDAWLDALAQGGGTLPACTAPDSRALDRNCRRDGRSALAGGTDYLYVYLPAGTVDLTVTTAGGTGDADLYYNPATWATPSNSTARSVNAGNGERLTVTNSTAGYRYISLYARTAFSGVTVSAQY
jgi:microbial collagenase